MKFFNDKKLSLFIYSNEITKAPYDMMEISLKKELEATKAALKLQTIRCRQLVAAFTRKLHEKELELRASKDLRDQQLSRLLRALLILESRLKKEQKLIRKQLEEKDLIIRQQEKEISKYRNSVSNQKWPMFVAGENDAEEACDTSLPTGEERLDSLCKGLFNPPSAYLKKVENESGSDFVNAVVVNSTRGNGVSKKEEITFVDTPVLESVNQILLRDEEELLKTAKPVSMNLTEKEERNDEEGTREWYETNGNIVQDEQIISTAWSHLDSEEKEESRVKKDEWPGEKASPVKCQLLEEKACLEMARKNLTVVDLEEIDSKTLESERAASPVKSTASYEEIAPVAKSHNYKSSPSQQKPPALPPKPARLLKPHQILQQQQKNKESQKERQLPQKDSKPAQSTTNNSGIQSSVPSSSPPHANSVSKPLPNKKPNLSHLSSAGGGGSGGHNVRPDPKSPRQGESSSKNRNKSGELCAKTKKNILNNHLPTALELITCVGQPFSKVQKKPDDLLGNCGAIKIGSSVSSLITGLSRETIVTELSGKPKSSVALVDGNSNNSIHDDSHVSQLVRQFEVLGSAKNASDSKETCDVNDIRKNFEEFKLEDSYVEIEDTGRHDGDGAENKSVVNYYATLTIMPPSTPKNPGGVELEDKMYETFLENTGLSQKSILTPSRMLSNHRSCLKPKDVKHRNRVKAAAAFERCNLNSSNGGSMIKYWTEPFL